MKTSKAIRFGPPLLGLVLFAVATASAQTIRARPVRGVAENLDVATHSVRLAPQNGTTPTELALTRQTKFVHNWHFPPADELNDGTRVAVFYHTAFFGSPFVTKVVSGNGA